MARRQRTTINPEILEKLAIHFPVVNNADNVVDNEEQSFSCVKELLQELTLEKIMEQYRKLKNKLATETNQTETAKNIPLSLSPEDRLDIYRITGIKLNIQNDIIKIRHNAPFLLAKYNKLNIQNAKKINFYVEPYANNNIFSKTAKEDRPKLLGEGAFGKVKSTATIAETDSGSQLSKIAMKKISKQDEKHIESIRQEIKALEETGQLRGVIETDNHFYVFTDLILGKKIQLKNYEQETLETKLDVCLSIIDELTSLHTKNIFHYDIKGDNIIVDNTKAKIIDFGSVLLNPQDSENDELPVAGTVGYMAPELGLHLSDEVENIDLKDKKTYENIDIYSLGQTFIRDMDLANLGVINEMVELSPEKRPPLDKVKEAIEKYKRELPQITALEKQIKEAPSLEKKMLLVQSLLQEHNVYSSSYQELLKQAVTENNHGILKKLIEMSLFKTLAMNSFYDNSNMPKMSHHTNLELLESERKDSIKDLLDFAKLHNNSTLSEPPTSEEIILEHLSELIENNVTHYSVDKDSLLAKYRNGDVANFDPFTDDPNFEPSEYSYSEHTNKKDTVSRTRSYDDTTDTTEHKPPKRMKP